MKPEADLRGQSPQQTTFTFDGTVVFDSRFDSGNMTKVVSPAKDVYEIFLSPDGAPYLNKDLTGVWFHFSVQGVSAGSVLSFTIANMSDARVLFSYGYRPVYRCNGDDWKKLPQPAVFSSSPEDICRLQFSHTFASPSDRVFFAFCYPFSYKDCQERVDALFSKQLLNGKIYMHREVLVESLGGREVELLTISSFDGISHLRESSIPDLFPRASARPFVFPGKPVIFLTARVHPGETPGSHMLNGVLDWVLSETPQGEELRRNFVFKVVPMLNPDGVARGYFRLDTKKQNLNRFYTAPSLAEQPTIFAVKRAVEQVSAAGNLRLYIDFHAHVAKRGCFVFGNGLEGEKQVENVLFAKLISLNSLIFDLAECTFTESSMKVKDTTTGLSREGSGRVGIYKATGLTNCYTLECNYHNGKRLPCALPPKMDKTTKAIVQETALTDRRSKIYAGTMPPIYNLDIFADIGRAVSEAILDFWNLNPASRVPMSKYKTLEGMRKEIGQSKRFFAPAPAAHRDPFSDSEVMVLTTTFAQENRSTVVVRKDPEEKKQASPMRGKAAPEGIVHKAPQPEAGKGKEEQK